MFGAICSGRPIQLAAQVEPTKYVISVPNASNVSHIAIFLLPQTDFTDPNYTALLYFQLPESQEFKLLGGLNPNKPSGIFKLNNSKPANNPSGDVMEDDLIDTNDSYTINIGLSIEPTDQAELQLAQEKEKQSGQSNSLVRRPPPPSIIPRNPNDIAALANKIVGHAYNFLGSFIDPQGQVPMKAFDNWWDKFRTKLANNPEFLNELD